MKRSFNYTDRQTLTSKCAKVHVGDAPTYPVILECDLSGYVLPADARVYLEAVPTGSPQILRFSFGTVGHMVPPAGITLKELADQRVSFTVKIVDESDKIGRLIALGDRIGSRGPGDTDDCGRIPILAVQPWDLGEQIWRLAYGSCVVLQYNRALTSLPILLANDTTFFVLIFPELIRQVLTRVLLVEGHREVTNEATWTDQWLRYAITWHPDQEVPPDTDPGLTPDAFTKLTEWAEQVVQGFCTKRACAYRLKVDREEQP